MKTRSVKDLPARTVKDVEDVRGGLAVISIIEVKMSDGGPVAPAREKEVTLGVAYDR